MSTTINTTVTVGPGGEVRLQDQRLRPGTRAQVMVISEEEATPRTSMAQWIGACRGLYTNVEDIDRTIDDLRNQWDRPA